MTGQDDMFGEPAVPVSKLKQLCAIWLQRAREQEPKWAVGEDLCRVDLEDLIEKAEKRA